MKNDKEQDSIRIYVDQEQEQLLQELQTAIADELEEILEDANLADRGGLEDVSQHIRQARAALEETFSRSLSDYNDRVSELLSSLKESAASQASTVTDLDERVSTFTTNHGSLLAEVQREIASLRNETNATLAKLQPVMVEQSNRFDHLEDSIVESNKTLLELAKQRELLSRVPGFVSFLLGEKGTLWLLKRFGIGRRK